MKNRLAKQTIRTALLFLTALPMMLAFTAPAGESANTKNPTVEITVDTAKVNHMRGGMDSHRPPAGLVGRTRYRPTA
jgi:hypothetical protein